MSDLIYLLEDDLDVSRLIVRTLTQHGFAPRAFRRMAEFEREARRQPPDLCIIDLSLPDGDGLSLLSGGVLPVTVPRIIVTGRISLTDRIVGLEVGADDYIVKPFEPRELVARIRAVLRRSRILQREAETREGPLAVFGCWTADLEACTLTHESGRVVDLSSSETTLLAAFLKAPGRVLSRSNLLDATMGRASEPFDRSMDARISRLRRKLDDDSRAPEIIRTVYGAGYIFAQRVAWSG